MALRWWCHHRRRGCKGGHELTSLEVLCSCNLYYPSSHSHGNQWKMGASNVSFPGVFGWFSTEPMIMGERVVDFVGLTVHSTCRLECFQLFCFSWTLYPFVFVNIFVIMSMPLENTPFWSPNCHLESLSHGPKSCNHFQSALASYTPTPQIAIPKPQNSWRSWPRMMVITPSWVKKTPTPFRNAGTQLRRCGSCGAGTNCCWNQAPEGAPQNHPLKSLKSFKTPWKW